MLENISKDTLYLINLISDIRDAAGDPHGKLMQDELVEHIRKLKEDSDKLRTFIKSIQKYENYN